MTLEFAKRHRFNLFFVWQSNSLITLVLKLRNKKLNYEWQSNMQITIQLGDISYRWYIQQYPKSNNTLLKIYFFQRAYHQIVQDYKLDFIQQSSEFVLLLYHCSYNRNNRCRPTITSYIYAFFFIFYFACACIFLLFL